MLTAPRTHRSTPYTAPAPSWREPEDLPALGTLRDPGIYRLDQNGHTQACVWRVYEVLYPMPDPSGTGGPAPRGHSRDLPCLCPVTRPWTMSIRTTSGR